MEAMSMKSTAVGEGVHRCMPMRSLVEKLLDFGVIVDKLRDVREAIEARGR